MLSLLALLTATADAAPDLIVEDILLGCTSSGGTPDILVRVRNVGTTASGAFYVDVFRGEPAPPPIGSFGEKYKRIPYLAAGDYELLTFNYDHADQLWRGWVDVLVDTDEIVSESNESNNHRDEYMQLLDCSFN